MARLRAGMLKPLTDGEIFLSLKRILIGEGMDEIRATGNAETIMRFGCCTAARIRQCNCAYSFECKNHGITCIGSHD